MINFLTGNPALIPSQAAAGGRVIGIDWRVRLDEAWTTVGYERAIQGNMDPVSLYCELPVLKQRTQALLNQAEGRPGHIFNLGHGILPDIPVEHAREFINAVKEESVIYHQS